MHTTRILELDVDAKGEDKIWSFIHDGDPRGGVVTIVKRPRTDNPDEFVQMETFEIPFDVLAEFVGRQVQSQKISELEQQTGRRTLGEVG
jgi:hypothetical protein